MYFIEDGEAVAQGQDHGLYSWVAGYEVVEVEDAAGLVVELLAVEVGDLAVPQGVVGDDEPARLHMVDDEVEVIDILPLVGIDKHQVEVAAKLRHYLTAVANVEGNAVAHRRLIEMAAQEVLKLILYLDAVDDGIVVEQSLGKALRRVARVGAQLQHPLGANHAH